LEVLRTTEFFGYNGIRHKTLTSNGLTPAMGGARRKAPRRPAGGGSARVAAGGRGIREGPGRLPCVPREVGLDIRD